MKNLSITIALHNNDLSMVKKTISSCIQDINPNNIYIVDNSNNDNLSLVEKIFGVNYLKIHNKGFGNAHNEAFKNFLIVKKYKYNLILNPDITFKKNTLKRLVYFLESNPNVGALMPRILNLDGSLQYARRCLPKPSYLISKRLFPNSKGSIEYELKDFEPEAPLELIGICGCFMLLRLEIIKKTELFDERFFMYFEDFDLARRISLVSKVIYYPLEEVSHASQREHKKNLKLFFSLIFSALKYFIKWGFNDKYTIKNNRKLLEKIEKLRV